MASHLTEDEREAVRRRLRRIEGQVRGVDRMVAEEQYCIDILNQIAAANSALEQVGLKVLEGHVQGCVREAIERGGAEADSKTEELLGAVAHFARTR